MPPVRIGSWAFEPGRRELRQGEDRQHLTELEHDLLVYLIQNAGKPVSAEVLLRDVWNYAPTVQSRAVPNTIRRLRLKLGDDGHCIVNVYGQGYAIEVPDDGEIIGRRALIQQVHDLLADGGMVTLYGLGGVGKTTIASTVAARFAATWVAAGGQADEMDFLAALARALGLPPARVTRRSVFSVLHQSESQLLVVDGAEGLGPDLHTWLADLRGMGPLAVLVTSRVTSGAEGAIRVDPLAESDAVRLFTRRAGEVRPQEKLSPELAQRLVRLVSGLPLATELAAARLRLLDLESLLADLEQDVAVLGQGDGSLEWALEASWRSLSAPERAALAAMAWVAHPLGVDTLQAVSGQDRWALLDAVDALVRSALLVEQGSRQFHVLDVVRAFVLPRADGEAKAAFVAWAVRRAEALVAEMRTDPSWAPDALVAETPTLLRALEQVGEPEQVATLVLAVLAHDRLYGRPLRVQHRLETLDLEALAVPLSVDVAQARAALTPFRAGARRVALEREVLDRALADGTPRQQAHAWNQYVFARLRVEGAESLEADTASMLRAARQPGVPWNTTRHALIIGSDVALAFGTLELAMERAEEALVDTVEGSLIWSQIVARLATLQQFLGTGDLGVELANKAFHAAEERKVPIPMLTAGVELLLCAHAAGRADVIEAYGGRIHTLARELAPTRLAAVELALAARHRGSTDALRALEQVIALASTHHNPYVEGLARLEVGFHTHLRDGPVAALAIYLTVLETTRDTDWHQVHSVAGAWGALAHAERGERGEARNLLATLGEPPGLAGMVLAMARIALAEGGQAPAPHAVPRAVPVLHRTRKLMSRLQGAPQQPGA